MKNIAITALCLAASMGANATDVWTGSQAITWDNTLTIEASAFADMQPGQKLVFEFTVAESDVIELHSNGQMLPGTRYARTLYTDNTSIEVYSTYAMIDRLKAYGLEVCGKGFTLTKIWYGDGKADITAETVWTGYFWMDSWSTLELAKTSFDGVDWSKYKAIRFYSEAGRTDYVLNVMTTWDAADKIADHTTMTMTNEYAELDITNIDMAAKLNSDRLMVQGNKESGEAFNMTAIALVPKSGGTTGIDEIAAAAAEADAPTYNIYGQRVGADYRGLVVRNGRKFLQ